MASTSLRPIAAASFDAAKARHLLSRAGFGGTAAQVAALQDMGLGGAVDHLVDYEKIDASDLRKPQYDSTIMRPPTDEERMLAMDARRAGDEALRDKLRAAYLARQGEDREQMRRLEEWWIARLIETPRPLEEKLVLLWHGHFATNHRTVHDSFLMLQQNALFRKHAAGSFAELALAIIRDPAMIRFLNNDSNNKSKPNENLARELMELFTLGEGAYGEADIKEGARALTGYGVDDDDFEFRDRQHDFGNKSILGQRGDWKGEDFVRILLARPQCPLFVSYKLYKHFAADIDERPTADQEAVIRQMAKLLHDGRYAIKPVLKALFKSEHFYSDEVVGNQIKSPAQLVAGTVRMLGTPVRSVAALSDAMAAMGQKLFEPPSVAGWQGGRGWINTSTLFVRQNLAAFLVTGKRPSSDAWDPADMGYDPMAVLEGLPTRTPEAVVDDLCDQLLSPQTPRSRRDELKRFMKGRDAGVTRDTVAALLLLITAMPEYQLC